MQNRGQSSIEIMMIVIILLGLLLATAFIMVQKNSDINRLDTLQRDMQKCDRIAATITSFSSNDGYSEAIVTGIEKNVRIEKGSVIVGNISCSYKGDVWFDGKSAEDEALWLIKDQTYFIKKIGNTVVFDE